ncbi:MAG: hypothetical protein ABSH56_03085 [Bryobacteraceae bacterium]|jgi:hypothetical protein
MALFVDGPADGLEELSAQDSQLLSVASLEGIDVAGKARVAREELEIELEALLRRFSYSGRSLWSEAPPGLEHIVVTRPLRLWHVYRTIELVYADAYYSQLNDRYAEKRAQFHQLAWWASDKLIHAGIGLVSLPLRRGEPPIVTSAPGNLANGTYYVSTGWVNRSAEESAGTAPTAFTVTGTSLMVQPSRAPECATGWQVYLGTSPGVLIRQNGTPIDLNSTWIQPDFLLNAGARPSRGQEPNYIQPTSRVLERG